MKALNIPITFGTMKLANWLCPTTDERPTDEPNGLRLKVSRSSQSRGSFPSSCKTLFPAGEFNPT